MNARLKEHDPTNERFIVDYGAPEQNRPARMIDINDLKDRLVEDIQYGTYGYDAGPPAVYRYIPGNPPQLESLRLACVQPDEFDDDDFAHPVWALTGPDGTQWATMSVRIDGRV